MNHLILDMTQYLNEEYETNAIRNSLQTISKYLNQIDYSESLYTQLLLQIQHQTILQLISDLTHYGYYHPPLGTEISYQRMRERLFCLSFEDAERTELLSNISEDIFVQFLMKKLLFRVNLLLRVLRVDYGLDINDISHDINRYVDQLNVSFKHSDKVRTRTRSRPENGNGSVGSEGGQGERVEGSGGGEGGHKNKSKFSQNVLPFQSPQERCVFQVHKYALQILTQIGHPVGSKVVTKYLLELAHHPNADIPHRAFSKVIKMNTQAKKYVDIAELTKVCLSLDAHSP
jgi:hypothetical protein